MLTCEETTPEGVTVAEAVEATLDHRGIAAPLVASEVNMTGDGDARAMTRRERFYRSRTGRLVMSSLAALGLASAGVVVDASPAAASEAKVYTTTDNVWLHADPGLGDINDLIKIMPKGTRFTADCYVNDTPIGERNNPAWLHGTDETGATGYFTDYYSDSHWSSSNTLHDQGLAFCGKEETAVREQISEGSAADAKACYFNLRAPRKNLTFSYGGDHRYLGNAWQAAKNWTDVGTGINIKQGSGNTYIKFKDVNVTHTTVVDGVVMGGGTIAKAIVPDEETTLKTVPANPRIPKSVTILLNRHIMDGFSDFKRTYTTTHEIGHALGLAHTEECGYTDKSIMNKGSKTDGVLQRTFNTPLNYDKVELKQLYN